MSGDYVSPIDERGRCEDAPAPRPADLRGRRVALLDISKARGDEFLDRVAELLEARGATTHRLRKPLFSRPAPGDVIEQAAIRGDLVVEGLAD